MSRLRSRALLAAGLASLLLTSLAFADTTGAEPESGVVDSTGVGEVATASTSPAAQEAFGGWTNWKGDAGRTGVADAGPTGEPVELWRFQADGECQAPPAVVAGVVYAACTRVLYALDAATGTELWQFAGTRLGGVSAVGELVYVNDVEPGAPIDPEAPTTILRALDAMTGQERWHVAVLGGSDPVVENGVAVIATGDGFLLGLDAATGAESWRFQVSTEGTAHSPALADGIAYLGGDGVDFFAVDTATGTLLWTGDTGDDQTRTAVVGEGVAYIGGSPDGGEGGHLYAFDAVTGELLWTRDEPLFTPTVLDGVGYSGGLAGAVDAFDTADGTQRWRTQVGGVVRNVAIAGDVVYALSDEQNITDAAVFALDAATGAELWSFLAPSGVDGGVAVAGGVAYVATWSGNIYAIGGTDQGAVAATTSPPSSSPVTSS
jgi:outer membrane protein assembly factor BamB